VGKRAFVHVCMGGGAHGRVYTCASVLCVCWRACMRKRGRKGDGVCTCAHYFPTMCACVRMCLFVSICMRARGCVRACVSTIRTSHTQPTKHLPNKNPILFGQIYSKENTRKPRHRGTYACGTHAVRAEHIHVPYTKVSIQKI